MCVSLSLLLVVYEFYWGSRAFGCGSSVEKSTRLPVLGWSFSFRLPCVHCVGSKNIHSGVVSTGTDTGVFACVAEILCMVRVLNVGIELYLASRCLWTSFW